MKKWKNLGDVNYMVHGGCLVRPNCSEKEIEEFPALGNIYDVFSLNTEAGEDGNQLSAMLACVDLDDIDEAVKKDILYACGLEEKAGLPREEIMSDEMWAKEMVECGTNNYATTSYHCPFPSNWMDYIITESELKQWLISLGAEEFIK